jgi:cytoskeleton protein RodZ
MTESGGGTPPKDKGPSGSDGQSMGTYLRAARRRRRISIDRAADETKIRSDFLMRMESDEFDFLAPAYVRGFLKTYTRYLRVDPEPLVAEFDRRFGGRVDTAQIIASQRKSKRRRRGMREPRRISSWAIAAMFAAGVLLFMGLIGIAQDDSPPTRPSRDRDSGVVADERESTPSPTPDEDDEDEATPTPTTTPEEDEDALAFADGIELEIVASTAPCWVDVTTDGNNTFSDTLALGQSETFEADDEMTIILGFPAGVELIVNGRNLGSPGGNNPLTLKLPDDVESL